jgi:lambda family phage portal protein
MSWISKLFGREEPTVSESQPPPREYSPERASIGAYGTGYGAGYGGSFSTNSDGAKFRYGLSSTGESPTLNHQYLRQNGRSAYHDSPQARAMIDRKVDTVVDSGMKLESTPDAQTLGLTDEYARGWAGDVQRRFHAWALSKRVSVAEDMNLYQMQRLYGICQERDGEVFTRMYYSQLTRLMNPLQLQFLDPNQFCGDVLTSTYGYQYGGEGIAHDARGREIGYVVNVLVGAGEKARYEQVHIPAERGGRKLMLHGFAPEYPGQLRGYSRLGYALHEFEKLTDFTVAQIEKAIIQSAINMYTRPSQDKPGSNPFADMQGTSDPFGLNAEDLPQTSVIDVDDRVYYQRVPEATIENPGQIGVFNLREGEDIKPFPETSPSEHFSSFVDAFTKHLCTAYSMPIEVLQMKFGQNYSASRATLLLFWRVAQIWRDEIAADFLNPVYEMWLSGEIAAGRVSAPGWSDPRLRAAWLRNNWIGAPIPDIDPAASAKAAKLNLEMGATTLDRRARELNGSDGETNRRQLAGELETLPTVPWGDGAAKEPAEDEPAEDEEPENG